ncbi:MAG: hypothetical protein GYB53_13630 [Rhodobacteraceae bacterium]|nr:hypothetical protein [Paracoccaceae bacterium]MBR9820498.1 hypothetical protein [Paracoccaceae bacterium]
MDQKSKRWMASAIKTAKGTRLKPLSAPAKRGPVARLRDDAPEAGKAA